MPWQHARGRRPSLATAGPHSVFEVSSTRFSTISTTRRYHSDNRAAWGLLALCAGVSQARAGQEPTEPASDDRDLDLLVQGFPREPVLFGDLLLALLLECCQFSPSLPLVDQAAISSRMLSGLHICIAIFRYNS